MPSNYTQNYHLNQWEPEDKVLRADFNADNAKIDEAIKAVDVRADGLAQSKADVSALEGLAATVNSLSGTVSGQGSTLTKKGNCQVVATSYKGTGNFGAGNACSLTFDAQPQLVVVLNTGGYPLVMLRPHTTATMNGFGISVSWSGNRVSWYDPSSASTQLNVSNTTYHAVALLSLS